MPKPDGSVIILCMSENNTNRERPNLLVIHTDQQSCWTLGCYGGTLVETPNIDRLAGEGVLFENFFTNSAVCTPSRGCLVTGRYPHCHGAYTNNIPLNADETTFATALSGVGYETGYAGKWHLDGLRRPGWVHEDRGFGFDDNYYMFNRGHWKKIHDGGMNDMQPVVYPYQVIGDERTYTTDWLVEKTVEFVSRPRTNPFCYMVSFPDPHDPVDVRPPYDTMFDPADMPIPDTFDEEGMPHWAEAVRRNNPFAPGTSDREARLRRWLALYCGEVKLLDDAVGRILSALETRGILDDTVVVFTVDHGEYAGEHGLMAKNQLYETAHRVPLIVRWPNGIGGGNGAGLKVARVLSTVDFLPTILGLMDVESDGRAQGVDASVLLRAAAESQNMSGESDPWNGPEQAFIHHSSLERAGIFTPEYELALLREGGHIMFDRREDPLQIRNLFSDPGRRRDRQELIERVLEHHRECESPAEGWLEKTASDAR